MRAVGRRGGWAALAAAVVLLGVGATSATEPLKVVLQFDGTGTFSATNGAGTDSPEHSDVALKWSTTYVGDMQPDGSITFQASGSGEGLQTTAPSPGTFHFTSSGSRTADCTGPLPTAPGPPDPVATLDSGTLTVQSVTTVDQNNQTGQINCAGTGPMGDSVDLSADAANLSGAFAPYLPDVLSARISLPADALKSGSFTKSVSSSDAVAQLPGSCADQFGEPDGQCPMSLSWSGTIKISVPCGVITSSEGDAPAVGTLINPGDTVSTGANSRVEITLPDSGIYRLGPNSKVQCNGQTTFGSNGRSTADNFKLLLGSIWAGISDALGGGGHEFNTGGEGAPGVRGSALTESIQAGGRRLLHVIQGTGYIRVRGEPEVDFPAGEGLLLNPNSGAYTMTTAWPAADQALVPAAQRPPKLTGVRIAGRPAVLHYTLSQNAAVTVQIQRGKRRVLKRTASARKGSRTLKLGPLPKGRYTLTVFATVQKRSAAVQKSFRVT
jgi:hypothetical protein